MLTVFFDDGLYYEIVLLDILGIVVLPTTSYVGQSEIALSKFAIGIYWLKLSPKGQVF